MNGVNPTMSRLPSIQFRWPSFLTGTVTSSWDDGTVHDRRLVQLFREHGFKGSFYLCSDRFCDQEGGDPRCISSEEVRTLYKGFEVGSHTVTHPRLWTLPPEVIFAEMVRDRQVLEAVAGEIVTGFVFPFGRGASGDAMLPLARRAGFLYARRSSPAKVHEPPADFFNWDTSCHCGSELAEQWEFFKTRQESDRLFNIWGHSYEFEEQWGWQHIEDFLQDAARQDGLWFATHRQVYDYISAWRGMLWSLDLGRAHNPSATPVFFTFNGREIRLLSGESTDL